MTLSERLEHDLSIWREIRLPARARDAALKRRRNAQRGWRTRLKQRVNQRKADQAAIAERYREHLSRRRTAEAVAAESFGLTIAEWQGVSDKYVRMQLRKGLRGTSVRAAMPLPPDVVAAKKMHLIIHRLIRERKSAT